jgi:2-polyprenyl-6-methoxyphenol hydroxylase-like FAD-dependent oxidoreductase
MRVLIIGGGIGGTALATFLAWQGKEVTLVERSPEWKNIGFGVTIWGIGRRILRKLGIEDTLAESGHPVDVVKLVAHDLKPVITLDFKNFTEFGGEPIIVSRAKLHQLLRTKIPEAVRLFTGVTVSTIIERNKKTEVALSNGIQETFDLVVGAEGVHSKTRELITPNATTPYNWSVVVFWMPESVSHPKQTFCISEADKTLCFYPTKERTFIAIARYCDPEKKPPAKDFISPFIPYLREHGWSDTDIEKTLAEAGSYFIDDMRYVEMGAWSKNNIALLGDARHAFAPIIGMGANMALEDAQVLAEELSQVNVDGIEHALKAYTKRRTSRVNRVRALSRFIEPWFNAHSRLLVVFRDAIIPLLPNVIMERMFISVLKEKV